MSGWTLEREHESVRGKVRYDVFGSGDPVVLVHGTPDSSYVWREIAPALARERTVYVYDLLGYGQSEKRDGQDVSLAAQGKILSELLDLWGLDAPDIVGHDFGGATALRAYLLEGWDFRSITLIDAVSLSPWGSPSYRLAQKHIGVFEQIPAYMHRAMVEAYIRDATFVPMEGEELEPYVEPWLGEVGQAAFYRQIQQNDPRYTDEMEHLYSEIEVPVKIIWGEDDRWIPLERGERLHAAIPGSEFVTIPECAHSPMEDAPERVLEEIQTFISR